MAKNSSREAVRFTICIVGNSAYHTKTTHRDRWHLHHRLRRVVVKTLTKKLGGDSRTQLSTLITEIGGAL